MNANPVPQPATDHWTRTTAEALVAFEAEHGTTPTPDWSPADYDTWTDLHLTTAA